MRKEELQKRITNIEEQKESFRKYLMTGQGREQSGLRGDSFRESARKAVLRVYSQYEIYEKMFVEALNYNDCVHDMLYYCGGYQIKRDLGPESKDRYFRVSDPSEADCYRYCCLDCYYEIEVSKENNEAFLNEHTVIKTPMDFEACRKLYYDCLRATSNVDMAYERFLERESAYKKDEEKIYVKSLLPSNNRI